MKNEKKLLEISFYTSVPKTTIIWGTVPEIRSETDRIFCHFRQFFYPPNNQENQNFKKMKKASRDVIILHMCTKNHNHMMFASWDMEYNRQIFVISGHFCPFTPLLTSQKKFGINVKKTWVYYPITNVYHKWWSYDVWFLRYKAWQTVILGHFLPFDPPNNLKNQSFEKTKKQHLKILLFYTCIPQMMIIWCLVPEIWSTTDRIYCHFGLFFALLPT